MVIDLKDIPTSPTFYFLLGHCVIASETSALIDGYCLGYKHFMELHEGKALNGLQLYGLFIDVIIDATRPSLENEDTYWIGLPGSMGAIPRRSRQMNLLAASHFL